MSLKQRIDDLSKAIISKHLSLEEEEEGIKWQGVIDYGLPQSADLYFNRLHIGTERTRDDVMIKFDASHDLWTYKIGYDANGNVLVTIEYFDRHITITRNADTIAEDDMESLMNDLESYFQNLFLSDGERALLYLERAESVIHSHTAQYSLLESRKLEETKKADLSDAFKRGAGIGMYRVAYVGQNEGCQNKEAGVISSGKDEPCPPAADSMFFIRFKSDAFDGDPTFVSAHYKNGSRTACWSKKNDSALFYDIGMVVQNDPSDVRTTGFYMRSEEFNIFVQDMLIPYMGNHTPEECFNYFASQTVFK